VTPDSSRKLFLFVLLITLAIRGLLAGAIPITGDEAYFVLWGRNLDYGYYDHPPMVGWLLYLLSYIGQSEFVVRLPAVLVPPLIAVAIQRTLRHRDPTRAFLAATLWLVLPLDVINVFVTTDTPLLLFATLSILALYRGLHSARPGWYVASGICLGLAFLSKYFAVLLGLAYLAVFIARRRDPVVRRGIALLLLSAVPFGLVNLAWNYNHCWNNLLFNLYSRNRGLDWSPESLLLYLVMLAYALTPWLLVWFWRRRQQIGDLAHRHDPGAVFVFALAVPLALLGLVALRRTVGLHWVLAFLPAAALLAFEVLDTRRLRRAVLYTAAFALVHLALLGSILTAPMELWRDSRHFPSIVMGTQPTALLNRIDAQAAGFHLATTSYSSASVLAFYGDRHVLVFGDGSHHARQDDLLTDFRLLEGADVAVLGKSEASLAAYAPFFSRAEWRRVDVGGASFPLLLGYNFDYQAYRDGILADVRDRYYRIPGWLPTGACYFCERYFPESGCR